MDNPFPRSLVFSISLCLFWVLFFSLLRLLARDFAPAPSSIQAVIFTKPPRIDGRLDDPAWEKAAQVDQFIQREPQSGQPVSEKTVVYLGYDRDALYFGFRCFMKNTAEITAKEIARDVSLGG